MQNKDFILKEKRQKCDTIRTKSFIPGVVRKQLVKRTNTENHAKTGRDSDEDICNSFSCINYCLAMALKDTPKPEIMHIQDEEDEDFEGGSDTESHGSPEKKSRRPHVAKKKSSKIMNNSHVSNKNDKSEDFDSQEELKVNINPNKSRANYANPGEIFKNKDIDQSDIDDIPYSAFESSSDSDSSDTFESVEPEELKESSRAQISPIKVENLSNESLNAGEDVMVSLSDIPIEIDQGLSDADKNNSRHHDSRDNGRGATYDKHIITAEKEVKLNDNYTEMASVYHKNKKRNPANFDNSGLGQSIKSLNANQINTLEEEIYMENKIREFEAKIFDSEDYKNDDKNKLRSFIKEYINNESKPDCYFNLISNIGKIMDVKVMIQDLLETSNNYKNKLKETVEQEKDRIHQEYRKEKDMRERVKGNIHRGKSKSKIFRSKKMLKNKDNAQTRSLSVVHPGHENFNLVFNIMLGIKKAIEAVIDFPMFEIQKKDFQIK